MTRFARAKGSKASNERTPEEATSWTEMKQQLLTKNKEIEENKKRQEVHNQRNANYKAFLEEIEENESKKTTWADFPGNAKSAKNTNNITKSTYRNSASFDNKDSSADEQFIELKSKVDRVLNSMSKSDADGKVSSKGETKERETDSISPGKKKSKQIRINNIGDDQAVKFKEVIKKSDLSNIQMLDNKINNEFDSDSDAPPDEDTAKKEVIKPVIKIKKPKPKKLKIIVDKKNDVKVTEEDKEGGKRPKNKRKALEDGVSVKKKLKKSDTENNENSKQKLKDKNMSNQKKKIVKENLTEKDLKKIEKKKQKRFKQLLKKKQIKAELKKQKEEMKEREESISKEISDQLKKSQISNDNKKQPLNNSTIDKKDISRQKFEKHDHFKRKRNEKIDSKEKSSRRKPFLPHKMFINGKELEIEYVDGFPVKKEDAERLKKLRREMISKGLPRSEINISMKLERRKAEKAFAREKKKVRASQENEL